MKLSKTKRAKLGRERREEIASNPPEVRTLQTVEEDLLWPYPQMTASVDEKDKRQVALAYVLTRIPENDYRRLAGAIDTFSWFIPQTWKRGSCELFPLTFHEEQPTDGARPIQGALVIYLSPTLQRTPADVLVAIVAHELAHVVLKHNLFTSPSQYDAQEEEADRLVCQWGFEREHLRHKKNKRRLGLD
jgi:Zn-dependent protease with chaperone function